MKFRTDFVTNSSSSSFVVEISVQSIDGKNCSVRIDPDNGEGSADLNCTAKEIVEADSVDELTKILSDSIFIDEDIEEPWEDEEDLEANREYYSDVLDVIEYWEEEKARIETAMRCFGDEVKETIPDIQQISKVELKRIWTAWGEFASGFCWNIETSAKGLIELSRAVLEAEGQEKEEARKRLAEYLADFKGCIGEREYFPSTFLGVRAKSAIIWEKAADSIDDFAQMVVTEDIQNRDYAEWTAVIDMQNHTISQKAEYIIDD